MAGRLETIIGPMFSGKSTELIRRIETHRDTEKCIIIKSKMDNRYSDNFVVTHDGKKISATSVNRLQECEHLIENYDVVGIDEGHFFTDLYERVINWCDSGKRVIITSLNCGQNKEPFSDISRLIGQSEKVDKLSGCCFRCTQESHFSYRVNWDNPEDWVGGKEKYVSLCRSCYKKANN